jgi:hypothetical protein
VTFLKSFDNCRRRSLKRLFASVTLDGDYDGVTSIMNKPGWPEAIIILLIFVVVVLARRLPEIMKKLGIH